MISNYIIVEEDSNSMFLVELHLSSGNVVECYMTLKQVDEQVCPMLNPYEWTMIKQITYKEAIEFLLPKHYSGRKPSIMFAYGWYESGSLVAVITYGKPASPYLCTGVCGKEFSKNVIELNRLCKTEDMKGVLSSFVSQSLKLLGDYIVVSYADQAMSHTGFIYQATNFYYTGATKSRTDKYNGEGKHARHYDKDAKEEFRQVRSAKHRYVIFTGNKRFKRKVFKALNYKVEPYPKEANKYYTLGEFIQPKLIRVGRK